MNDLHRSLPRAGSAVLLLVSSLAAYGCSQRDEITSYEVLKPEIVDPTLAARPTPVPGAKQRTIGLIIPAGDMSWFFKLTGPPQELEPLEDAFLEFVKTVKLSGGLDAEPSWTLPPGWQQLPGSQFRYATIRIPAASDSGKPQEITVSQAGGDVLSNVNRWRGQLNLEPIAASELAEATEKLEINGREATYVSLVGTGSGSMGGGPFAGGELPPGHPPIGQGQKTTSEPKK